MYYYLYQTKNLINDKTYIGVHSTKKLNDGYIGGGIKRQSDAFIKQKKNVAAPFVKAVIKYGYENFHKEILAFFDTQEEAYEEEKYLVNEQWIKSENNYNVKLGGICPPDATGVKRTDKFKKLKSDAIKSWQHKLVDISAKTYVISIDGGEPVEYTNLTSAAKKIKIVSVNVLRNLSLNRTPQGQKGIFCYLKNNFSKKIFEKDKQNYPIISVYHKDGRIVTGYGLNDIVIKTKTDPSNMSKVIRKKTKHTKGWSCKAW
jgi:hypothetical protein